MKPIYSLISLLILSIIFSGCQSTSVPESTSSTSPTAVATTSNKSNRPMDGQESFGLSVCEEVSKDIVSAAIGKPIEVTDDKSTSTGTGCTYFTNQAKYEHILIQVSYLSVENQKQGQTTLERTLTTDPSIPMDHFIAMQDDGQINAIYLVMTPNKYVRVDLTANTADNAQLIDLAKQVALIIIGQ